MSTFDFTAIEDGVARVCADAVSGHIFASGITASVLGAAPEVVAVADDFTEVGLPMVTCVIGDGEQLLQPGNLRLHFTILGSIWRPRVPLGENKNLLLGDLAALLDAFAGHTKGYLTEASVQSAVFLKWSRPTPRSLPSGQNERLFLTLPFEIAVVAQRPIPMQPA